MVRKIWTNEEVELLKESYYSKTAKEIAALLGRNKISVQLKVAKLGLQKEIRWTDEEKRLLLELYGVISDKEIAKKLNRTVFSIVSMASILGLREKRFLKRVIEVQDKNKAICVCKMHGECDHKLVSGRWVCLECSRERGLKRKKKSYVVDYDYVRKYFESKGFTLLSKEYKNARHPLQCVGSCGHFLETSWNNFFSCLKGKCTECGKLSRGEKSKERGKKSSVEFYYKIKKTCEEDGYEFLTTLEDYLKNRSRADICCPKKHVSNVDASHFVNKGHRCNICGNEGQRKSFESIITYIEEEGYKYISGDYENNKSTLVLSCPKNHVVTTNWHMFHSGNRCKHCSLSGFSRAEKEVVSFIRDELGVEVIENSRDVIEKYEVDIFCPEKKIAIEYNGLYWHSYDRVGRKDYEKFLMTKEKGYRYISIFEDEWLYRMDFVKDYLREVFGVREYKYKLRPSEVLIKEVSKRDVEDLLNLHHYNGCRNASIYYGIYFGDKIIGCFLLAKPTRQTTAADYEIVRMCLHPDYKVHGLWSFFSKHILKKFFSGQKIVSFSDNRRDTGKVYERMGFKFDGLVNPNYYWCKGSNRFHKSAFRKKRFEKDLGKTEIELRIEQGYYRVFDVGKTRWILDVR